MPNFTCLIFPTFSCIFSTAYTQTPPHPCSFPQRCPNPPLPTSLLSYLINVIAYIPYFRHVRIIVNVGISATAPVAILSQINHIISKHQLFVKIKTTFLDENIINDNVMEQYIDSFYHLRRLKKNYTYEL